MELAFSETTYFTGFYVERLAALTNPSEIELIQFTQLTFISKQVDFNRCIFWKLAHTDRCSRPVSVPKIS